ncbi:MAG: CBS domain-containing protein [Pirellulaceae bacterium]
MELRARDVMTHAVRVIEADLPLTELEHRFLADEVGAYAVCQAGKLVGVVTRTDVLKEMDLDNTIEQLAADQVTNAVAISSGSSLAPTVGDVMTRDYHSVDLDEPLSEIAKTMFHHKLHHILVVEAGQVKGVISSFDFVRLYVEDQIGGQHKDEAE